MTYEVYFGMYNENGKKYFLKDDKKIGWTSLTELLSCSKLRPGVKVFGVAPSGEIKELSLEEILDRIMDKLPWGLTVFPELSEENRKEIIKNAGSKEAALILINGKNIRNYALLLIKKLNSETAYEVIKNNPLLAEEFSKELLAKLFSPYLYWIIKHAPSFALKHGKEIIEKIDIASITSVFDSPAFVHRYAEEILRKMEAMKHMASFQAYWIIKNVPWFAERHAKRLAELVSLDSRYTYFVISEVPEFARNFAEEVRQQMKQLNLRNIDELINDDFYILYFHVFRDKLHPQENFEILNHWLKGGNVDSLKKYAVYLIDKLEPQQAYKLIEKFPRFSKKYFVYLYSRLRDGRFLKRARRCSWFRKAEYENYFQVPKNLHALFSNLGLSEIEDDYLEMYKALPSNKEVFEALKLERPEVLQRILQNFIQKNKNENPKTLVIQ